MEPSDSPVSDKAKNFNDIFIFLIPVIIVVILYFMTNNKGHYKGPGSFVLFHASRCPPCVRMMPAWNMLKNRYANIVRTYEVNEVDDKGTSYGQLYNIRSTPTIRWYPNGMSPTAEFVQYTGNRSYENMVEFLAKKLI